jgi:hypothetical protein
VQPKQRADQRPSALDTIGFSEDIAALRQQLQGVVRAVADLGETIAAVDQRVAAIGELAETLDGDPDLREFLAAGSERRRLAMQLMRVYLQRGGVAEEADGAAAVATQRKVRRIAKRA